MTETMMIKIFATVLFVGVPTLIAALMERALRDVSIDALRRSFWSLMIAAAVLVLVLVALNPARSGSAELKIFGNILAGLAFASFFGALVVGFVAKQRGK